MPRKKMYSVGLGRSNYNKVINTMLVRFPQIALSLLVRMMIWRMVAHLDKGQYIKDFYVQQL